MIFISVTVLITERFHAVRLGKEKEGGMTKKAAIVTLVTFWFLMIAIMIIEIAIDRLYLGQDSFQYYEHKNQKYCYQSHFEYKIWINLVLILWAFITSIVTFIGTIVMWYRKSATPEIKKAVIYPTVVLSVCAFLYAGILFSYHSLFYGRVQRILFMAGMLIEVTFPVIWLVTWARNGDISLKCGPKKDGESIPLL